MTTSNYTLQRERERCERLRNAVEKMPAKDRLIINYFAKKILEEREAKA